MDICRTRSYETKMDKERGPFLRRGKALGELFELLDRQSNLLRLPSSLKTLSPVYRDEWPPWDFSYCTPVRKGKQINNAKNKYDLNIPKEPTGIFFIYKFIWQRSDWAGMHQAAAVNPKESPQGEMYFQPVSNNETTWKIVCSGNCLGKIVGFFSQFTVTPPSPTSL